VLGISSDGYDGMGPSIKTSHNSLGHSTTLPEKKYPGECSNPPPPKKKIP